MKSAYDGIAVGQAIGHGRMVHAMQSGRGNSRRRGFTLTQLIVVIVTIFVIIMALLPMLGALRRNARSMQNGTQLRGIHQSIVIYSQGNNGWYPGFDRDGVLIDASTEYRFEVLLKNNHFSAPYMIDPKESATVWKNGPVTHDNYSYAMLCIEDAVADAGRRAEWRNTNNPNAAVISDRNIGVPPDYKSLFTDTHHGDGIGWIGNVAWNDNHASFEPSHVLESTKYGDAAANTSDNLFEAAGPNDAMMTFSQRGEIIVGRRPPLKQSSISGAWAVIILIIGFVTGLITMAFGKRIRHKPAAVGTISHHETSQR
jgi:type II secretory pathway pseudopilin PulG